MKKQNNKTGSDFISNQQSLDKAKNEKIKEQPQANRDHKTDVSQKKTGGGKLSAKGD